MAIQFGSYEALKHAIKLKKAPDGVNPDCMTLSFVEQSASGFTAGVISKFITMPLDVIKKRFQVSGFEIPPVVVNTNTAADAHAHTQPIHANPTNLPNLHQHQPIIASATPLSHSGCHVGLTPPLSSASTISATRLSSHATTITPATLPTIPVTPGNPAPSSTIGGVFASPAEMLAPLRDPASPMKRRRRHDQPVAGRRPFTGVWDCARGILAHEGIQGLFKGSIPSILKAGPNSAIIYMVYEYSIRWLNREANDSENGNTNTVNAPGGTTVSSKGNDNHKFKP